MSKRIVLTGGGTGGHIMPNLALIPALTAAQFDIHYIGLSTDRDLVLTNSPQVTFHTINSVKLVRPHLHLSNALIPFKLVANRKSAISILKQIKPDLVFSKGGFVSLPVMLAAQKLGLPYIIHESDYSLGVSNKLCQRKAKVVLCSFASVSKKLKNAEHTGSPIRPLKGDKTRLDLSNFNPTLPTLLAVGGSSGAVAINDCIIKSLDLLLKQFNVLHITGKNQTEDIKRRGYLQIQFAHNMADYIDASDFIVTRAGANALFEFVSLAKPTIAIPLPKSTSRGDQLQNAKYFFEKKCILVLQQEDLTTVNLVNKLTELQSSKDILKQNCKGQSKINGTQRIVEILINA
ncbi:MAG: UDP-N-acetylglucosamine--N-acetylmuramyl-(pentapeptide) pyrophosphoryl-undecaprenol N-acetylglucosamine transferase [Clostridiales bacterium]|jgi:UDP-N-acetylglucosamine--N-acetylmuramyl-(pentapeptide) pyrophosphoryl-undecaprenol N-acetylglucosamine transferase|nr:UDP-N-acetylglucosamine--N-acetylmuramyl-(pentapeptide) pyrophosphoryl-undecaprenol N-acetylglucosamine transferase [Clostridiales bacterium]